MKKNAVQGILGILTKFATVTDKTHAAQVILAKTTLIVIKETSGQHAALVIPVTQTQIVHATTIDNAVQETTGATKIALPAKVQTNAVQGIASRLIHSNAHASL